MDEGKTALDVGTISILYISVFKEPLNFITFYCDIDNMADGGWERMNGICFMCVEGVTYYIFIMGPFFDTSHIANNPTVSLVFLLQLMCVFLCMFVYVPANSIVGH